MEFADLHIHALCNVDDGANTEQEMFSMIDASYADGVRTLCLTPHFHPGYFGNNHLAAKQTFDLLQTYIQRKYPQMTLYLGNELRYSGNCISWLEEGLCRTLNNTRYCLVDFMENEKEKTIIAGVEKLLNAGYCPILAHAERYCKLERKLQRLEEFRSNGITIQVDAQSLFGAMGRRIQRRARNIVNSRLADLIASDAHDCTRRPPGLSKAYAYIKARTDSTYAGAVCCHNALHLLQRSVNKEDSAKNYE